jgi:KDO2-lipid IV(A) lauroyltransferase
MKRRWRKIRYRFEWLGLLLLTSLVPLLPRCGVVWLANFIGTVAYYCDARGRRIAQANIAAALGQGLSAQEQARVARASYRNFSRTMCDLFWSPRLTVKNYRRYIRVENGEVLQRLRARGESAVIVCIHHGNFEWASLAVGFEGISSAIVTETFKNRRLSAYFKKCREVSGHRIIPQEASMLHLYKRVRKGGIAGILVDLNLHPGEAATIIDAFGMKMCVTMLHSVLVKRGAAQLVPLEGRSEPDGTCRVICHEPLAFPANASLQEIAQRCWSFFEPMIRRQPEHWLWAYKHWRYQPTGASRAYPFYARHCTEFERLRTNIAATEEMSRAA